MAKKSALDVKIAEVDALTAACHSELIRLRDLRAFLTGDDSPFAGVQTATDSAKPKRTRGKGKKAAETSTDRPTIGDVL